MNSAETIVEPPLTSDASQAEKALNAEKKLVLEGQDNPIQWSRIRKGRNNTVLGISTFALTYASSAVAPSLAGIVENYNVSSEASLLNISLFVLGFGLGPFVCAPLSDVFGRRPVYLVTFFLFSAFSWGVAFAPNFAAIVVFRFLSGFSGSSAITNQPASISDFTTPAQRNRYSTGYAIAAFLGASMAPLISGFIVSRASWRWNLIVVAIFVSFSAILLLFGAEESYAPVLLAKKHKGAMQQGPSLAARCKRAIVMPFKLLFTEPVLALVCAYLSILYAIFYAFFAVFPIVYVDIRGWSQESLALSYIALSLGFIAGWFVARYGNDYHYSKIGKTLQPGQRPAPEERFAMMYWTNWTVPIGIFLIAFCSYRHLHWFGDTLGMFLFSFGTMCIFTSLIPFLVDLYLANAACALAAAMASRAILACALPLVSRQMYDKLGVPGASCLLAGITVILTPMPWVFRRYKDRLWAHKPY